MLVERDDTLKFVEGLCDLVELFDVCKHILVYLLEEVFLQDNVRFRALTQLSWQRQRQTALLIHGLQRAHISSFIVACKLWLYFTEDLARDPSGALRVAQSVQRLVVVVLTLRNAADKDRPRVPAQRLLQDPRELRVPVWDELVLLRLVREHCQASPKCQQRLVDVRPLQLILC